MLYRPTDPETSRDAVPDKQRRQTVRDRVLGLFQTHKTLTDEQLAEIYPQHLGPQTSPSGLRTRRAELVDAGLVVPAGFSLNKSGRRVIIWALNEETHND